jgi:serine/threonine-protein kinase
MDQGSGGPAAAQVLVGRVGSEDVPRASRHRTGTAICGWTLERALGGGPVCDTWLAGKAGNAAGKSAVVRVLREPFAGHTAIRADWVGASWAVNRFYHPRVPKVLHDGVDEAGAPVVIRGWARGTPLDQIVRGDGLDPTLVLRIAEQLLDALEMAHAHGVVHGALSPSNVIVTSRGSVRLVDFATTPGLLARPTDALFQARAEVSQYVAPEHRASEQSDVWSVGACIHFALAGVPPSAAPLAELAPDADPALTEVVERALAADPLERYESAYAMLGDIRCVTAGNRPSLMPSCSVLPSAPAPRSLRPAPTPAMAMAVPGLDLEPGTDAEFAAAMAGLRRSGATAVRPSEWRGNLLLFAIIGVIVAVAAWVMIHERRADPPPPAAPGSG